MDLSRLQTSSLQASPHGERVRRILAAALDSVEPASAVKRYLRRDGDWLIAGNPEQSYRLENYRRVILIGFGKASVPMAQAVYEILGNRLSQSLVITKSHTKQSGKIHIRTASHPVPDESNLLAGQQMLALLNTITTDDLVLCLISGGGSALLSAPVPGIQLKDLQALTNTLLACGANIHEINTLRKHLSSLKGGQLARLTYPAQIISLILSDVVGDSLDVIASGPTAPDPTSYRDALDMLQSYGLLKQVPQGIRHHLDIGVKGLLEETPKPGDPIFERVQNVMIGNNKQAAQAAAAAAQLEGFNTLLLTINLEGEAQEAGKILAATLKKIALTGKPIVRPACVIAGGETTVTLTPESGLGGRNQELALAAINDLANLPDIALVTLATDGNDGPTDAAGAVVTGESQRRAQQYELSPDLFLARHDSYRFFEKFGDLLKPGLTQTNVNDLVFLFAF